MQQVVEVDERVLSHLGADARALAPGAPDCGGGVELSANERRDEWGVARIKPGPPFGSGNPALTQKVMERETGLEPATSSLGSWHSTTELLPRSCQISYLAEPNGLAGPRLQSIRVRSVQKLFSPHYTTEPIRLGGVGHDVLEQGAERGNMAPTPWEAVRKSVGRRHRPMPLK